MQITRTKKALIAVIALVLVCVFVTLAAVCLPDGEQKLPSMDNTVADSGSGANTVSTVSASASAPLEDGKVPDGYQPEGTGITDISVARGDLDGKYYLTDNITINSLAIADNSDEVNIFTGVFDGNGKTITIDATSSADIANGSKGGLFAILQGTVKNCVIVVENFQAKFRNGTSWANAGIIAGSGGGGNTVVENVRIILKHSPNNMSNGQDNAYISQYVENAERGAAMRLGGVFGNVIGDVTITDSTVDNQTSGNYGFSSKDWRGSGDLINHSDGFAYIGGFFGRIQSGNISATGITLAGSAAAKMHAYSESTSKYRYNQSFIGGIVGYADEGKIDINGLIISYPMNNNFGYTNGNYNCASGIINGYADDNNGGSISNAYIVSGAESAYNQSNGAGVSGSYNVFASDKTPLFVGSSEIAFNGFTKQAPSNASAIVATLNQSGTAQNVMEALIAKTASEAGQSVWLTVPVVNATSTTAIDFAASYATASTVSISGSGEVTSVEDVYFTSKEYDGNIPSASVVLGDGKTDLSYSGNSLSKNVGTYTLNSNIASASGYGYIDYEGVKYVYNIDNNVIYTPQTVAGETFDITKPYRVEITQRAITLGNDNGNVTYGDTLETVQLNNIPVATQGSVVAGEYVESCTVDGYVQFAANAGEETAFGYTGAIIKDADGNDVTGNYDISFAEGKAVVKQQAVEGILSADDLVYNATAKTAKFSLTGGELYNDDAVSIAYSGDQINVTTEGFIATATLPSNNYTFGGENGNAISQTFYISPKTVEITKNESATTVYDYSGVVPNEVLLTLFNVPKDVDGGNLFLNFAATYNGEEATVQYAGTYTVTATLAAEYMNDEGETVSQANYTAAPCEASITIKAKDIHVSINEEVADSKVYDGKVVGEDYLLGMFAVDGTLDEGGVPELTLSVAEGEVLNAGVYNLSVSLHPDYNKMYAISATSVTTTVYTVNKVDVEITGTEYSGQSFNNQEFTDYASLFNAPNEIDGATPLALEYSVAKGGEAATIFNVGTYTVTAKLADNDINGNYNAAPFERTYEVEPWVVEIVWSANDYTYTGEVQTVTAKYTDWNSSEIDLAVSFGEGVEFRNAGKYTATASFAEGDNTLGNYALPEVATNEYDIKKATSVINVDGIVKTYTYTGELQTVTGATLNHSEAELIYSKNTFTTVAEGNGMDIYVSVEESANYYGASTVFTITVNKAVPEVTAKVTIPEEGLFTSSEMPAISADSTVEGAIVWDTEALTEGENSYAWTFTPVDTENYEAVTGSETLTVKAVAFDRIEIIAEPSKINYEYGDKFDKTGMVVEAVNNDDSREVIEDYIVADEYLVTLGENQIEVSYNEKIATVSVYVEAKVFELEYNDLTVVAGTPDFDVASIKASIVGTDGSTVNIAGIDHTYSVAVAYTDAQYDAGAEVDTEYPLTVTVTIADLDSQYYVGTYTATLKVIATPMEGNWASETFTAEYDGTPLEAEFNVTKGGEFEIRYAPAGTEEWTTEVPVNAGEYVAKVVSTDNGYSSDKIPTVSVIITKKTVVIESAGNVSSVYNGEVVDPSTLFNAPYGVNDYGALAMVYTVTKDGETTEILGAGTYNVTAELADESGNYTASELTIEYTVDTAKVTVTWTGENSLVFNGEIYEPVAQASGLIGEDVISVTYAVNEGSSLTDGKARNAGSYTAMAVLPSENYEIVSGETFGFTIEKVRFSIEVKALNKDIEYGSSYVWTISDFYGDATFENSTEFTAKVEFTLTDDLSGLSTADKGTKYYAYVQAGPEKDGVMIVEEDLENFEFLNQDEASVELTLTVVARKVAVTATDTSATYDGEKVSIDELLAMFGLEDGKGVEFRVDGELYQNADMTDAKEYSVEIFAINSNYDIVGTSTAAFTVEKKQLTVSGIKATDREYNGNVDVVVNGTLEGVATGDDVTLEISGKIEDKNAGKNKTVIVSAELKGADISNYSFETPENITVNISAKQLTVEDIVAEDKVYDGNTDVVLTGGTLYGIVGDDQVALNVEKGVAASKNAGARKVNVIADISGEDKDNYVLAPVEDVYVNIAKADLRVEDIEAIDREYNRSSDVEIRGTLVGVIGSDDVVLEMRGVMNDKNVGENKPVTVYANISGIDSANYDLEKPENATVNISKVTLTVSATAHPREYDGTTSVAVTGYLIGVVYGDNVNLTISGTMADKNVGINKPVTVNAGISGNDVGNYELAETGDLTVTITSKAIEVVWGELTFEYDGTSKVPTATADTGIDGETVEITVSGAKTEPGKYVAVAKTDNENYILMGSSVTFSIVRKEVAAQFTVGYGELTITVDGGNADILYRVDGGVWKNLPASGKITVELAAKWTVDLRYANETSFVSHTVYTSADNVMIYLDRNLKDNAIENKSVIETAKAWLENAIGDKTQATAKVEEAEAAYDKAMSDLTSSVENAFKATANVTGRTVAVTVAIATAATTLGLAAGAIVIRRKGGKKNEK